MLRPTLVILALLGAYAASAASDPKISERQPGLTVLCPSLQMPRLPSFVEAKKQ